MKEQSGKYRTYEGRSAMTGGGMIECGARGETQLDSCHEVLKRGASNLVENITQTATNIGVIKYSLEYSYRMKNTFTTSSITDYSYTVRVLQIYIVYTV